MPRNWGVLLVALGLACVPAAANASVLASAPQDGKAVFLLSACDGRALTPAGLALPAGSDEGRWLAMRQGENGFSLRAYGEEAWLGVRDGEVRIAADLTPEERLWNWRAIGDGQFQLSPALLPMRMLEAQAQRPALSQGGGCATRFSFDPFPVLTPTRRTLHVDAGAGGRGGEDGSEAAPFRSITAALGRVRPGERILVHPGEYREAVLFPKALSGKRDAWIVLQSAITHAARIIPPPDAAGVDVQGDFVEVHGFEVINPGEESCIKIDWGSSYQRVVENFVHDCGGGGVVVARSDHSWIEGNLVARTSARNRYVMSGISIWQSRVSDRAPGYHNVIRRNISYGNENRVPGKQATDGNGIVVDDLRNRQMGSTAGPFPFATLVEDNLVFDNGGSGVRILLSDKVTVRRNTSYMNLRLQDNTSWRGEIMNVLSADTLFEQNLAVANTDEHPQNYALFDSGREPRVRWRGNLGYSWPLQGRSFRQIGGAPAMQENNLLGVRPMFASPRLDGLADFRVTGLDGAAGEVGARMELLPELR